MVLRTLNGMAHPRGVPQAKHDNDLDWQTGINHAQQDQSVTAAMANRKSSTVVAFPKAGISARDLMSKAFAPIKFVVPGYLVEGLTVFAGAPKLGKSWAVLDWAVAVASGGLAFGSVGCIQGDVLYLALEDNERRLQSRLQHMRVTDAPDTLTFATEWSDLDGDCIARLEEWLTGSANPRLIAIDVFAKVRGASVGRDARYDQDYKFASKLQKLAIDYGVAIVLVHHTRKQEADDPFDAVSGTHGLTGAADSVLVLRKDAGSQQPILYGRGRDLPEIETVLEFQADCCRWRIMPGGTAVIANTPERREILSLLSSEAEPMSPTELAAALGKGRSTVNHALTKLFQEGKVDKHAGGRYTLMSPIHSVHSLHSNDDRVNEVKRVNGGHRAPAA
ncbi:AAA family ATPase [Sphingomonas sp. BN140010]|uniref:AAA family ATPase n=1 Tax=Sphingomonas arvum TaxID=2992113 RepID=A0ABT3JCT2_9SPHN|nr:AAA family ATPase [Sphingomonas sp. BN140010]MCW3796882.1 AAA family ATPase [Sphingomonas sp. BN140010]